MIKTVGVIGAGTMGNGIAQVFAQSGFTVVVQDVAAPALDRAKATIEKSLAKFVEKGKLGAADRDAALGRLSMSTDLGALAQVVIVLVGGRMVLRGDLSIGQRSAQAFHRKTDLCPN
jgi:3-hydroxybutyryl-CoA dehydrogenase